jgi:hypothetical protein
VPAPGISQARNEAAHCRETNARYSGDDGFESLTTTSSKSGSEPCKWSKFTIRTVTMSMKANHLYIYKPKNLLAQPRGQEVSNHSAILSDDLSPTCPIFLYICARRHDTQRDSKKLE